MHTFDAHVHRADRRRAAHTVSRAVPRLVAGPFALLAVISSLVAPGGCTGGASYPDGASASPDVPVEYPDSRFVRADGSSDTTGRGDGPARGPDGVGPRRDGAAADGASPTLPGSGKMQAQAGYLIRKRTLRQAVWRGNQGWTRSVPLDTSGKPQWNKAGAWSGPIGLSGLPGKGSIQCTTAFLPGDGKLHQGFWRGDQGWARTVPLKTDGSPNWNKASAWGGPIALSGLPGSGSIQAQTTFRTPAGRLVQGFWRGDHGWSRTVPLKSDRSPDWNKASSWSGPLGLSTLPGKGSIQALSGTVLPSKQLQQGLWRGDRGWSRTVPMKTDGSPDWGKASAWQGPLLP